MPCLASHFNTQQQQLFFDLSISASSLHPDRHDNPSPCRALIDTGATNTCISPRLVKELKLIPVGKMEMVGLGGIIVQPYYIIDVYLPFKNESFLITGLHVSVFHAQDGLDVLMGMDIIGLGHLSVDAFAGRFTFCV